MAHFPQKSISCLKDLSACGEGDFCLRFLIGEPGVVDMLKGEFHILLGSFGKGVDDVFENPFFPGPEKIADRFPEAVDKSEIRDAGLLTDLAPDGLLRLLPLFDMSFRKVPVPFFVMKEKE